MYKGNVLVAKNIKIKLILQIPLLNNIRKAK